MLCAADRQTCYCVGLLENTEFTWEWRRLLNLELYDMCGPGSVVGIATGCGLDGPGIRISVGPRFSAPVQTGPGAHPASCTKNTGSFRGA